MKLIKEKEAQLRKMERSFSQTYELLSDGIFVDKGDEKSVQTQMMSFVLHPLTAVPCPAHLLFLPRFLLSWQ